MKIKITVGVFGHRVGDRVVPVNKDCDPIIVDDAIGKRLISQGVAVEIEETVEEVVEDHTETITEAFPEFDEKMTRAKLEEIALSVGIKQSELDAAKNKGDVLALLEGVKTAYESDADAPTFDPSEDML